ncbi:MAG: hypothetical protein ACRD2A_21575, partial [Vicinamibacterales bacterium]
MLRKAVSTLACAIIVLMTVHDPSAAQAVDSIRYTLRFPAPHTHYVEVEAGFPTGGRPQIELFMAVWTPGSYLIREYERHVENLMARVPGGGPAAITKTRKNRWQVETGGAQTVTVTYRVYGREMTVRNNWIESAFAMLNGAPTFISLVGGTAQPHDLRIELPADWKESVTALTPGPTPHTYRADDFDTLVDSPIFLGNPVTRQFQVAGKRHVLALEGDTAFFDADRAGADLQKIVDVGGKIMGGKYDYPHYYMLNLVSDAGGGLEHKNSSLTMSGRYVSKT